MGFFNTLNKQSPNDFDVKAARFLFAKLQAKRITQTADIPKWSSVFQLMRLKDEIPEEKIKRVLVWYTKNINQPRVPICRAASSFRKKFDMVAMAAQIDRERSPVIVITEEATDAAARCGCLWPKGVTRQDELEFFQLSIDNHRRIKQNLRDWKARLEEECDSDLNEALLFFIINYLNFMGDTNDQAVDHGITIWRMAWRWPKWTPPLRKWAFSAKTKAFRKRLDEFMDNVGASENHINHAIGVMNGNS